MAPRRAAVGGRHPPERARRGTRRRRRRRRARTRTLGARRGHDGAAGGAPGPRNLAVGHPAQFLDPTRCGSGMNAEPSVRLGGIGGHARMMVTACIIEASIPGSEGNVRHSCNRRVPGSRRDTDRQPQRHFSTGRPDPARRRCDRLRGHAPHRAADAGPRRPGAAGQPARPQRGRAHSRADRTPRGRAAHRARLGRRHARGQRSGGATGRRRPRRRAARRGPPRTERGDRRDRRLRRTRRPVRVCRLPAAQGGRAERAARRPRSPRMAGRGRSRARSDWRGWSPTSPPRTRTGASPSAASCQSSTRRPIVGSAAELAARFGTGPVRGEITIVLWPRDTADLDAAASARLADGIAVLIDAGLSPGQAADAAAALGAGGRNAAYRAALAEASRRKM